ncbi:MAG: O-antigen ligase family protein [Candidatus Aminicenantaceae bacterium]
MTISFRKYGKILFLFLIIFALFIFPSSGSRSGFLGLAVSFFVFFLLFLIKYKTSTKKKFIFVISFFLVVVIFLLSFFFFSRQTNLFDRLDRSLSILGNKDSVETIFVGKLNLWTAAYHMIKDYPLSGVGLGAYIVELPNYSNLLGFPVKHTDSAENYFFQVGSELGLIGIFLVFWLFFEIIRHLRSSWKSILNGDRNTFILIGIIAGIVSIFVNFFFHSYIGSFEIKYFFWLLIALAFAYPQALKKSEHSIGFGSKFIVAAIIFMVVYGAVHLWNSTHSLSINSETKTYGWTQNYGLYGVEEDNRGFLFQWAKKSAGITVENLGPILVIPMVASHPDIEEYPVKVKVFSANKYFRKKKLIKEIVLKKREWLDTEFSGPYLSEKKMYLVFETDRTWQPLKYLGAPDPRALAVGLGEEWFRYPEVLSEHVMKSVQKISSEKWEGDLKNNLLTGAVSYMKFNAKEENFAIRLWVRGEKAFGIGPYIIIKSDNHIIGKTQLTTENWASLVFTPEIGIGQHILSVEFINDFYNPELGQDRNVFLGDIDIIYLQ